MYSITSKYSFEMLPSFRDAINKLTKKERPIVVVGTQGNSDRFSEALEADRESEREVTKKEAIELTNHWKCPFFETSAGLLAHSCELSVTGQNVDAVFRAAVNEMFVQRTDPRKMLKNSKSRGLSISFILRRKDSSVEKSTKLQTHSAPPRCASFAVTTQAREAETTQRIISVARFHLWKKTRRRSTRGSFGLVSQKAHTLWISAGGCDEAQCEEIKPHSRLCSEGFHLSEQPQ